MTQTPPPEKTRTQTRTQTHLQADTQNDQQADTQPQYLIELYSPNAAWLALPAAQRQQFLGAIASAMAGLAAMGVEVLALSETEAGIDQASGHQFLGIWRFAGAPARDALLAGIRASGWYGYFDHVNAASGAGGLASHMAALASA